MVLISCTGKNSKKLFYTQLLLFTYGFTDLTDLLTSSFSIFFFFFPGQRYLIHSVIAFSLPFLISVEGTELQACVGKACVYASA